MADCELCGRRQESSNYLCSACQATVAQQLAAFPYLYRNLADALSPLGSNWPRGDGHGTAAEAPLPLVEHPLVLRGPGGIVGVLEDWQAALWADRGWPPPRLAPGIEPRVHAAVKALRGELSWIAAKWPAAGEFAREVTGLYRNVTSITAPDPRPGVRIGHCPAVVEGRPCGAVLRAAPGAETLVCPWCSASYPPRLWGWLRNVQDELVQAS